MCDVRESVVAFPDNLFTLPTPLLPRLPFSAFAFQACAALPAQVKGRRIFFPALGAGDGRPGRGRLEIAVDDLACAVRIVGFLDPELRGGGVDGKLAGDAGSVRVQDANAHAPVGEEIREEVSL